MQTLSDEHVVWQGSPSWKALLLFYIKWTLVSLLPVAAWIVLDRLMDDPPSVTWFVAATVAGLALTYVVGWIKRATTRYRVTDRRIQIRTGLVSRNESSANLSRVQNVNVAQSAFPNPQLMPSRIIALSSEPAPSTRLLFSPLILRVFPSSN